MKNMRAPNGFTLVEMSVVLLIIGLIVGAFFAFLTPYYEQKNLLTTIERQNKIARAIADFTEKTGALPCPGAPDGTTTAGPEAINPIGRPDLCGLSPGNMPLVADGIVPYRVLGLSQQDATDGYGNPFTFAVSPYAVRNPVYEATAQVHANCRFPTWIPVATNLNIPKAFFCCKDMTAPAAGSALEVFNDMAMAIPNNHVVPVQSDPQLLPVTRAAPASFGTVNAAGARVYSDNLGYSAYILISHGKNGEGAYIFGQDRRRPFRNPGNGERENANYDHLGTSNMTYVDLARSTSTGAGYYDDVVLWRTQEGVYRELGHNSCSRP